LVFATERGIEDLWTVHAPRERWGYELELPQGWRVQAASSVEGLAEVRDDRDVARLRMWARVAWDATGAVVPVRVSAEADRVWLSLPESVTYPVIVDPEWTATDTMVFAREAPKLTPLANGQVLVTGGESSAPNAAELFDPISSSFTTTSDAPSQHRVGGWAFRMGASQVLLVGGRSPGGGAVKECELYDVDQDAFQIGPELVQPRQAQTVVQLRGGDVLVAGGYENDGLTHVTFAELIDSTALGEASTMSSRSGDLVEGQAFASGLLLPSGKALLTGGDRSGQQASASTELFNPNDGSFEPGRPLPSPRASHQSLLRPDGRVLLLGGLGTQSERLPELEWFDSEQETDVLKTASTMIEPRATGFSTVALADGSILIIGGDTASGAPLSETELHYPEQRAALPGPRLHAARRDHGSALLPDGRVLVAGSSTSSASSTAELLNPNALYPEAMKTLQWPRTQHTATRLSSGEVLIVGGEDVLPVDLFDPTTDEFRAGGRLDGARSGHTATLLSTGQVLVVGGAGAKQSVDLYDPQTQTIASLTTLKYGRSQHTATLLDDDHVLITGGCSNTQVEVIEISSKSVEFAGSLSAARYGHAAMLLADGRVLIAGGSGSSAEIFDPSSYKTKPVPMNVSRANAQLIPIPSGAVVIGGSNVVEHFDLATDQFTATAKLSFHNGQGSSATLLRSGEILVAGGGWYGYWDGIGDRNAQTELYDPQMPTPTVTLLSGTMIHGRVGHTATLLVDGRVLLTGGTPGDYGIPGQVLATAELYDPDTQTFSAVDRGETVLSGQSAVLLPSGSVLIAGGHPGGAKDAVLRNQDGTIVSTGEMTERRTQHAATALRDGTVLVTGGHTYDPPLNTAELYDEALDGFRAVSNMTHARYKHTATLLPNGRVLLAGGTESNEAELYDPATKQMLEAGAMVRQRYEHGAAVLSNGLVLIAGGVDVDGNDVEDAELYDPESSTFRALDVATGIGGPTRVGVDMAGNVFLAGRGRGAVLDERLELVSTLSGLPDRPTTIVPSLWGGITICGAWEKNQSTSCHEASTLGLDAAPSVLVPGIGGTTTRLASGDLLVRSLSADADISAVFRIAPPNTIRPTVTYAPPTIRIGEEVVLTGTRFTSPPTPGAEAQHDFPDILPWLVFVPNAGAPVLFPLKDWTDTRLQFEAASTAWHGPGWLHVMVQGVPSDGRYIVLEPKLDGAACNIDAACEHGSCAEGVCCNDRCDDPCWSCRAANNGGSTDGECLPIVEGNDPKDACVESTCGLTGVCDGQGQCASIEELSACATGRICREGSCEPTLGEDCTSTLDCAEGQACSEARTCVVVSPSSVVVDGGCSFGRSSSRGKNWLAWVTVALVLSRRRRRAGCRVLDQTQP